MPTQDEQIATGGVLMNPDDIKRTLHKVFWDFMEWLNTEAAGGPENFQAGDCETDYQETKEWMTLVDEEGEPSGIEDFGNPGWQGAYFTLRIPEHGATVLVKGFFTQGWQQPLTAEQRLKFAISGVEGEEYALCYPLELAKELLK